MSSSIILTLKLSLPPLSNLAMINGVKSIQYPNSLYERGNPKVFSFLLLFLSAIEFLNLVFFAQCAQLEVHPATSSSHKQIKQDLGHLSLMEEEGNDTFRIILVIHSLSIRDALGLFSKRKKSLFE